MSSHEIFIYYPSMGFLILLIIPYLFGQFLLSHHRHRIQSTYTSSHLLSQLMTSRSGLLRITKTVGWTLVWIFICLAMMQPYGNIRYPSLASHPSSSETSSTMQQAPHEVIFLVDTSASMRVPDGYEGQTRLESAKEIIEDVLSQLHGQEVSLYAFTSQLSAVVPSTLDYIFTRLSIKNLQINQGDVGGTLFAPVLTDLKKEAYPEPSLKRYTIVMLTDGGDAQLESLFGEAQDRARELILNAIPNSRQFHLHLLTVGLGSLKAQPIPQVTQDGKQVFSKLEPKILEELARRGKGKYYQTDHWTSWDLAQELVSQIDKKEEIPSQGMAAERKVSEVKQEDIIVDLYFQIPLGLALFFYFLNLLLPDVYTRSR